MMQLSWVVIKVKSLACFLSFFVLMLKWVQVWRQRRGCHGWEKLVAGRLGITRCLIWWVPELNRVGGKMFYCFPCCTSLCINPVNPFGLLGAASRSRMQVLWGAFKKERGTGSLLSSSPSILSISSAFSLLQGSPGGRWCCTFYFFHLGC